MSVQFLLIISLFPFVIGENRKITAIFNPGCANCSENTTLLYVKCVGASDIIHQTWDFTDRVPILMFNIAGLNSTLKITWDSESNKPTLIEMSEIPSYRYHSALEKLYEYEDEGDKGFVDLQLQTKSRLSPSVWYRNDSCINDAEDTIHVYGAINYDQLYRSGRYDSVYIKIGIGPCQMIYPLPGDPESCEIEQTPP